MLDTQPTFGSIESTDEAKRAYAAASLQENGKVALFRKLLLRRQETEVEPTPQAVDEEPAVAAPAPTQGPDYMLWFFVAGGAAALAAFLWVMSME